MSTGYPFSFGYLLEYTTDFSYHPSVDMVNHIHDGLWGTDYDPENSMPGMDYWDNGKLEDDYEEFMDDLLIPGKWA